MYLQRLTLPISIKHILRFILSANHARLSTKKSSFIMFKLRKIKERKIRTKDYLPLFINFRYSTILKQTHKIIKPVLKIHPIFISQIFDVSHGLIERIALPFSQMVLYNSRYLQNKSFTCPERRKTSELFWFYVVPSEPVHFPVLGMKHFGRYPKWHHSYLFLQQWDLRLCL